ncbi:MAG: hypothetical protein DCC71_09120 [Proteobacteria bacterium]|nr:MAG: hypothetical protein DCC71_09120 [Pseudomonadota bacterium]
MDARTADAIARARARERERAALAREQGQPLWMFMLRFLVLVFAIQRGGAAAMAYIGELPAPIWLGLGAECVAALVAGAALWIGARWAIGAALALGAVLVAVAALQVAMLGAAAVPGAISRAAIAVLGVGGLVWVLRRYFAEQDAIERSDAPAR